ncbi:MAG: V-type ATP synthase subunit I [Methanomassiliicoccales archaeon]
MVLKPEKIVRVRIIATKDVRAMVLSALHDAEVLQIEEVSPDAASFLDKRISPENYEALSKELLRFRGLEAMLVPHASPRRFFASTEELLEATKRINIDGHVKVLREEENKLAAEQRELETRLSIVETLLPLNMDLASFSVQRVHAFIAYTEEAGTTERIRGKIPDAVLHRLDEKKMVVAVPAGSESELAQLANELQMRIVAIPAMQGMPAEVVQGIRNRLGEIIERLSSISNEILSLSKEWFPAVAQIREQLEIETRKYEVMEKLQATDYTFALEGWMPESRLNPVKSLLDSATNGRAIVSKIEGHEDPPTLLKNPRRIKLFEFFIRFYSLPQDYEIDPTLVFAIIFPVFFGLMVGDWGYGLMILAISLFIIHRVDHPVAKSHIPKFLRNFVLMIMGPNALKTIARALIPSSIIAIVAGLLFNEFFGFAVLPFTVLSLGLGASTIALVTSSNLFYLGVGKLLLFTGYFGLSLVTLGLVFGAVNEFGRGHVRGAIGKGGWLMFGWGIAVLGLDLIHGVSLIHSISGPVSIGLIVIGAAVIAVAEGTMGVMEIPSIISHILSYTRIVGILLASIILAQVINIIFFKGIHKSLLLGIVGVIILIVGQLFNLIIAVFEPGIQGARLLYVEFFSKFYKGNGRYFRPFATPRNYTIKQFDLERGAAVTPPREK